MRHMGEVFFCGKRLAVEAASARERRRGEISIGRIVPTALFGACDIASAEHPAPEFTLVRRWVNPLTAAFRLQTCRPRK